jgi:Fic family protein
VYQNENATVTLTLHNKVTEHRETIHEDTIQKIHSHWKTFSKNQRAMISYLFVEKEATISEMIQAVGITDQAIRYNLKKLESLEIIEKLSDKPRDPLALYRFKNK